MDSVDEIIEYLKNLECYNFELVVTYMDGLYEQSALDKLRNYKPETRFEKYANRGFDIGPFIDVIGGVNLDNYDVVVKLQTKGVNKTVYAYRQFFRNRDWFLNLFDGVLGPLAVHKMVDVLNNNDEYGIVAASNLIVRDPPHKQELVKSKSEIDVPDDYLFVAGSCFAIRAKCLKDVQKLGLTIRNFEPVERGVFSFGHMMERAICFTIQNQGYDFFDNRVDFWRHFKYGKAEKKLRELSALNLYNDGSFKIDKDAAIRFFEMAFMSGYDVEEIDLDELIIPGEVKKDSKYRKIEKSLKKGYDEKQLIVIDQNNNVIDGRYRVEIMKKSWKNNKIKVLRINTVPVDVTTVKAFSNKIGDFTD